MDLDYPTLFARAARLGSLAAVALARGTDPSTISRRLAALEASLGVRLFQSTTRSLSLTEAGDLYPSRALPLVAELTRLGHDARAARSTPTGLLRLTASVTFGQAMILPLRPTSPAPRSWTGRRTSPGTSSSSSPSAPSAPAGCSALPRGPRRCRSPATS